MNVSTKALFQRIINSLLFLFVRHVTVSGVKRYRKSMAGVWDTAEFTQRKGLIYAIPKALFNEYSDSYPITDIKELQQVLAAQYYDQKNAHHIISQATNGVRKVTTYTFAARVYEVTPFLCWLIPEPLLICIDKQSVIYEVESVDGNYFCFKQSDDVIVSQLQSVFCVNSERFRLNSGISDTVETLFLDGFSARQKFMSGVKSLPLSYWHVFLSIKNLRNTTIPWKKLLTLSVGVLLTYLLITTFYLTVVLETRAAIAASLSSDLTQVLSQQDTQIQLNDDIKALRMLLHSKANMSHYGILAILNSEQYGVQLQSASINGNVLKVRGVSERATLIVEHLGKLDYVAGITFTAPTLKTTSGEVFDIVVTLVED